MENKKGERMTREMRVRRKVKERKKGGPRQSEKMGGKAMESEACDGGQGRMRVEEEIQIEGGREKKRNRWLEKGTLRVGKGERK